MVRKRSVKPHTLRRSYLAALLPYSLGLLVLTMAGMMINSIQDLSKDEKRLRLLINEYVGVNLDIIQDANGIYDYIFGNDIENKLRIFQKTFSEIGNDPMMIDLESLKLAWGENWDLYIIDSEGIIVATTYPPDQGMDFRVFAEPFVRNLAHIRESGEPAIDKITLESSGNGYRKYGYLSSEDRRYVLELGLRIPIDEPLFLPVNPSHIETLFSFMKKENITIEIVQMTGPPNESKEKYAAIRRDMRASGVSFLEERNWSKGTVTTYSDYKTRGEICYSTIKDYFVVSTFPMNTLKSELVHIIIFQMLQILCIFFVGLISLRFIVRSLVEPIRNMIDDISRIAEGEWDHPIAAQSNREYITLKDSVENLVASLKIEKELTQGRQAIIEKLAYTHRISGLPNLQSYYDRRIQGKGAPTAVVLLNLDDFSRVNTAFGHEVGNEVIRDSGRKISEVLARNAGAADWELFHINTDGLLLVSVEKNRAVVDIGIRALFSELITGLFLDAGREFFFTVSLGAVICAEGSEESEQEMLRKADIAVDKAKERGKNVLVYFEDEFAIDHRNTYALVHDIWDGIRSESLHLVYQPIVDIGNTHSVGFEALLRTSPDIAISPLETIQAAEDSGLIHLLGNWILREAISQARTFISSGIDFRYISINISPLQFREQELPARIADMCREMGVSPNRIQLEITETAMMKFEMRMISVIQELKELGFRIAMDDFGTGYSSLAYLARLPIDVIKIEKYMTNEAFRDTKVRSVVILIMKIAKELSLEVIAEGIESDEQALWMVQQGCLHHQGYLYSRPLCADQSVSWLIDFEKGKRTG